MIKHECDANLEETEIFNTGDEDPEEYGWFITYFGEQFSHPISFCPYCGMDLMKVEWADLK